MFSSPYNQLVIFDVIVFPLAAFVLFRELSHKNAWLKPYHTIQLWNFLLRISNLLNNSSWKKSGQFYLGLLQCCQTCSFPANLDLFFCEVAFFFKDLRVASFWACFNWNLLVFWTCFLQISVLQVAFFQILWHFCCFNLLLKVY